MKINCKYCIKGLCDSCINPSCLCRQSHNKRELIDSFNQSLRSALSGSIYDLKQISNNIKKIDSDELAYAAKKKRQSEKELEVLSENECRNKSQIYKEANDNYAFASDLVNDISLPGHLSAGKTTCGKWNIRGCLDHGLDSGSIKKYTQKCHYRGCNTCWYDTTSREANSITNRMIQGCVLKNNHDINLNKKRKREIIPLIISLPKHYHNLMLDREGRKIARGIVQDILSNFETEETGVIDGGTMIDHPYRFNEERDSAHFSPHFHFIITGWLDPGFVKELYELTGIFFKGKKSLKQPKNVFGYAHYLLGHSAVYLKPKDKRSPEHSVRYFGEYANSKFKTDNVYKYSKTGYDQIGEVLRGKQSVTHKVVDREHSSKVRNYDKSKWVGYFKDGVFKYLTPERIKQEDKKEQHILIGYEHTSKINSNGEIERGACKKKTRAIICKKKIVGYRHDHKIRYYKRMKQFGKDEIKEIIGYEHTSKINSNGEIERVCKKKLMFKPINIVYDSEKQKMRTVNDADLIQYSVVDDNRRIVGSVPKLVYRLGYRHTNKKNSNGEIERVCEVQVRNRVCEPQYSEREVVFPLQKVSYSYSTIPGNIKEVNHESYFEEYSNGIGSVSKSLSAYVTPYMTNSNNDSTAAASVDCEVEPKWIIENGSFVMRDCVVGQHGHKDNPAISQIGPPANEPLGIIQMRFDYGNSSNSIIQSDYHLLKLDTSLDELCTFCSQKMLGLVPIDRGSTGDAVKKLSKLVKSLPLGMKMPMDNMASKFVYRCDQPIDYKGMTYFDFDGVCQYDDGVYSDPDCIESLNPVLKRGVIESIKIQKISYDFKIQNERSITKQELEKELAISKNTNDFTVKQNLEKNQSSFKIYNTESQKITSFV